MKTVTAPIFKQELLNFPDQNTRLCPIGLRNSGRWGGGSGQVLNPFRDDLTAPTFLDKVIKG